MQLVIISIIILALCFLAMGIRIWIKGKFADTEVGHNPHMRKLGLHCAKEEEIKLWQKNHPGMQVDKSCGCCSSCCQSEKCDL